MSQLTATTWLILGNLGGGKHGSNLGSLSVGIMPEAEARRELFADVVVVVVVLL